MATSAPITLRDLSHSLKACHRCEDELWRRLDLDERSSASHVSAALDGVGAPPAWCSREAWERIADSMREWVVIFGNLELYWSLRRKRDE